MIFGRVLKVAGQEFAIMVKNPVVLVMLFISLFWAGVNAADAYVRLHDVYVSYPFNTVEFLFAYEYNNYPPPLAEYVAFLTLCLGVLSLVGDRSGNVLRLLLTKPLYRKDVILGKIVGMYAVLFMVIAMISALYLSFQLIAIGFTGDFLDVLIRTGLNVLIMSLYSFLVAGIVLLFSMIFKNSMVSLIASVSFVYSQLSLSFSVPMVLGIKELGWIIPSELYFYIVNFNGQGLQSLSQPLDVWFGSGWPFILLLLAELLIVLLSVIVLFDREEA